MLQACSSGAIGYVYRQHLGLYKHTLMLVQWQNCLSMHFSGCVTLLRKYATVFR